MGGLAACDGQPSWRSSELSGQAFSLVVGRVLLPGIVESVAASIGLAAWVFVRRIEKIKTFQVQSEGNLSCVITSVYQAPRNFCVNSCDSDAHTSLFCMQKYNDETV